MAILDTLAVELEVQMKRAETSIDFVMKLEGLKTRFQKLYNNQAIEWDVEY